MNKCPICNRAELSDTPDWPTLGKDFLKRLSTVFTPTKIPIALFQVGKIIYHDFFSNTPQTEGYLWSENCKNYILRCPQYNELFSVGVDSPKGGNTYSCPLCTQKMVYMDERSEDSYIPDPY